MCVCVCGVTYRKKSKLFNTDFCLSYITAEVLNISLNSHKYIYIYIYIYIFMGVCVCACVWCYLQKYPFEMYFVANIYSWLNG